MENNLDEFFVTDDDSNIPCTDDDLGSDLDQDNQHARRRDVKLNRKNKQKKQRYRRLSNSNLVIPTSEDEEESSSSEEENYENRKRKGKNSSGKTSASSKNALQCVQCAEYHDFSVCQNKKSNQRYMFYENVRNKFAKDVGFSYKRSFEDRSLPPG